MGCTASHNHQVRLSRVSLLVILLAAGQLVALPGIAEGIETALPGDDCDDDCPADGDDGKCGTSCDQCTCCARSVIAVLLPSAATRTPGRVTNASPILATRTALVLPESVYRPPRA